MHISAANNNATCFFFIRKTLLFLDLSVLKKSTLQDVIAACTICENDFFSTSVILYTAIFIFDSVQNPFRDIFQKYFTVKSLPLFHPGSCSSLLVSSSLPVHKYCCIVTYARIKVSASDRYPEAFVYPTDQEKGENAHCSSISCGDSLTAKQFSCIGFFQIQLSHNVFLFHSTLFDYMLKIKPYLYLVSSFPCKICGAFPLLIIPMISSVSFISSHTSFLFISPFCSKTPRLFFLIFTLSVI